MTECGSCTAVLAVADRFCPACGNPNCAGKLHPRFGRVPQGPPSAPARRTRPPADIPHCPRCWAAARLDQPYCTACGMSLEGVREAAERAQLLWFWRAPGASLGFYREPGGAARTAAACMAIVFVLAVAVCVTALGALPSGTQVFPSLGVDGDLEGWGEMLQLASAASLLVASLAFVRWFAMCCRNLDALGVRGTRWRPGWALTGWFLPLVNLVVPKEVADDLWRASSPREPLLSTGWCRRTVPLRLHLWWVSVLGSAVLLAATQWVLAGGAGGWITGSTLVVAAHVLVASAALLSMRFVSEVTSRQRARAADLAEQGAARFRRGGQECRSDEIDLARPADDPEVGPVLPDPASPGPVSPDPVSPAAVAPASGLVHTGSPTVHGRY